MEDKLLSKLKKILRCPSSLFGRNKRQRNINFSHLQALFDDQNISVSQYLIRDPRSNAMPPMGQSDFSQMSRLPRNHFQQTNQMDVSGCQPLHEKGHALIENSSNHYEELDIKMKTQEQDLLEESEENPGFYRQDSFIFGTMMVSRYQVAQCISMLSDILDACDIVNDEIENKYTLVGMEVEKKVKLCIQTLNSFDLTYYDNCKLSSHSSTESYRNMNRNMNEDCFTSRALSQERSDSLNMSSQFCDLAEINELKKQIDALVAYEMHQKENEETYDHYYEKLKFTEKENSAHSRTNTHSQKQGSLPKLRNDLPTCSFAERKRGQNLEEAASNNSYESISSTYMDHKRNGRRNGGASEKPSTQGDCVQETHNSNAALHEDSLQKLFRDKSVSSSCMNSKRNGEGPELNPDRAPHATQSQEDSYRKLFSDESISSSYISSKSTGGRNGEYSGLNSARAPRASSHATQSHEDSFQKLMEIFEAETCVSRAKTHENMDSDELMQCDSRGNHEGENSGGNQNGPVNTGAKLNISNSGLLLKDTLFELQKENPQHRVAKWVMSIDSNDLLEDPSNSDSVKGCQCQIGDTESKENLPTTVKTTEI